MDTKRQDINGVAGSDYCGILFLNAAGSCSYWGTGMMEMDLAGHVRIYAQRNFMDTTRQRHLWRSSR